jgi:hypothetical protein
MTPTTIFNAVHAVFGITPKELMGKRRPKPVTDARFCAVYMLSTEANMEQKAIARLFNKSQSGWASWCINRCEDFGQVDKKYAAKVAAVYGKLKGVTV